MKASHLFCGLIGLALIAQPARAERVALVIGNSNYGPGLELKNPVNDAHAVAASLRRLNFKVIERLDQNLEGMEEALREFNRTLKQGDVGWFFYAGHGLQADKANYLLPIGSDIQATFELKRKTIDLETIKGAMVDSGARLNVVVLDCCRDNPLSRSLKRSITRGLAPIAEVPDGMIVSFSTAANTAALDGEGANSPFTTNLVSVLDSRPPGGLEVKALFFTVGQAVKKSIDQRPYLEVDSTMSDYFLDREAPTATESEIPASTFRPAVLPPAAAPAPQVAAAMPPVAVVTPLPPGSAQPPTQVVFVTPPGVTNTLSGVFANGPYAAYNSYSQGQILRKVQEKMQGAGLYKSKIDGGMGLGTQAAINAWQQTNGLTVTGLLDQATLQQMMLLGLAEQPVAARSGNGERSSSSSRSKSRSRDNDNEERSSPAPRSKWQDWIRPGGGPIGPRFGF